MRKATYIERECEFCHKKYNISAKSKKRLKYCSFECRKSAQITRGINKTCPICSKPFHTTLSAEKKYCSVECYAKAQTTTEHQNLYKKTLLDKYGVTKVCDIPGVKEKREQTCIKNHGVSCVLKSKKIRDLGKKTCLERYGDEYPQRTDAIKEKTKETCLERYGSDSFLGSNKLKEKVKSDLQQRYNVTHYSHLRMNEYARSILLDREKFNDYINNHKDKSAVLLYTELGVDDTTFYAYIDKYDFRGLITHSSSHFEKEIKDTLPEIVFKKDRTVLDGMEIDLYSDKFRIGIEFNGSYWHSDAVNKDKNKHSIKTSLAAKKGVFLFHIFEYEWVDARIRSCIISRLRNLFKLNSNRIAARKCGIKIVSSKEAADFYNSNHIQGKCPANIHLGLYNGNNLVAVMSFKTNGINTNYEWELCRFACLSGFTIQGGASKLFKFFLNKYKPKSIISYSDIAKTSGNIYKRLGFSEEGVSHPQYVWVKNGNVFLTRYSTQLKKLIAIGWKTANDGKTEEQVMREHGFYKLYDCGKKVWVYKK